MKRKRTAPGDFEIIRSSPASHPQTSSSACTVTFDRSADGRPSQRTEMADLEISPEDLAVLAEDPQYSAIPEDNFDYGYFERIVQADEEHEPASPKKPSKKVKQVHLIHFWFKLKIQF